MKNYALALAALSIIPFQIGCDLETFADSDRFKEDFQYNYDLKPGGRITLENFNGSVEILSWEKNSVQITGTKYASTQDLLASLKIETNATPDSVTIRTVRPSERRGNMGARYFLRVPRNVELSQISSSNGQIRVEDISGNARLDTSNGAVRLSRMRGRLEVKTSNGSIEGSNLDGDANLRTSNGGIRLDQINGAIEAITSNAGINISINQPKPSAPVRLSTSNGGIDLAMQNYSQNEIRASTSNASIVLRVPPNIKANVRAQTSSHESVNSELEILTSGRIEKGYLEGQIGGGGPQINLTTSNATIRLLRL
jgi:DUF4097 and DUF4098 domain-containing protein YvlB